MPRWPSQFDVPGEETRKAERVERTPRRVHREFEHDEAEENARRQELDDQRSRGGIFMANLRNLGAWPETVETDRSYEERYWDE